MPRLALTFDGGPDPRGTPAVLEALARAGASATFFVLGERAAGHPSLLADVRGTTSGRREARAVAGWPGGRVRQGTRQNRHQPLRELSVMALAVLAAAERRVHGADAVDAAAPGPLLVLDGDDLVPRSVMLEERPPLRSLRGAAEQSAA